MGPLGPWGAERSQSQLSGAAWGRAVTGVSYVSGSSSDGRVAGCADLTALSIILVLLYLETQLPRPLPSPHPFKLKVTRLEFFGGPGYTCFLHVLKWENGQGLNTTTSSLGKKTKTQRS